MARRRFVVFLCLMLLIPNALFLLERPTPTATPPTPTDTSQDWGRPQRVQQVTKFLLTPTFPIHALWITALAVLSIVAVADILLKLVFTCCTLGVEAVTGYRKTRLCLYNCICRAIQFPPSFTTLFPAGFFFQSFALVLFAFVELCMFPHPHACIEISRAFHNM